MKKRQRLKNARKINDWYKNKKINEYDCPYCSWCALNDEEYKYQIVKNKNSDWFGGIWWDVEATCPHCGTKFEYSDSN